MAASSGIKCTCAECRQDNIRERLEKVKITLVENALIISARTEGETIGRRQAWDAMHKKCNDNDQWWDSVLYGCYRTKADCTFETCPLLKGGE